MVKKEFVKKDEITTILDRAERTRALIYSIIKTGLLTFIGLFIILKIIKMYV